MARVKGANKMGFADGYKQYSPDREGLGSPSVWRSLFRIRMSPAEAHEYRRTKSRYGRMTEYAVLNEFAGSTVSERSVWSEIKSAFKKASLNTHPDRIEQHGKGNFVHNETGMPIDKSDSHAVTQAEFEFKHVTAAFTILQDIYTKQGRLN